jgi:hypothetical protein
MINYGLPKEMNVCGVTYPITNGGDYRVVLDVITALNDNALPENKKVITVLSMFYEIEPKDVEFALYYGERTFIQTALDKMMQFINCGEEEKEKYREPPLMDWEQDFPLMIAPINKALGREIRNPDEYLHWWTFVSGYMEIDECFFSHVTAIRQKRMKGERLDKQEQEFFRKNADKIILKNRLTQEEIDFMNEDDDW